MGVGGCRAASLLDLYLKLRQIKNKTSYAPIVKNKGAGSLSTGLCIVDQIKRTDRVRADDLSLVTLSM